MEPRQFEEAVAPRGESTTWPPCQPERSHRFRQLKREERIAPGDGRGNGGNPDCGCADNRNHPGP